MSKRAAAIELTDAERVALEKISRAPKSSQKESQRARIILMAASGMQNKDIAEEVGLNPLYVGLWRRRFQEKRTAGLKNCQVAPEFPPLVASEFPPLVDL